ncbi:hypothetical protein QBC35DRAFT_371986 [Podospora australis]|uniref:DUF1479 domain protein n=1 Tax=Podospora australis TaxID=1536484 RepID=A0AAN6X3W5_9PEZI|nr:hypothetical protein QBC35DRAFT_371986 [Podospora australis]
MGSSTIPSADNITDSEFQDCLGRYPERLEAISTAKGAKDGQKTLADLDDYRYGEAVDAFSSAESKPMTLEDVKLLVEWKLRHGKFRPTLMKLVSSNEAKAAQETIQEAVKYYREKKDVSGALQILTQLKGIGPATASLLLAVHDADNVIFFADEAFYWLCCGGAKGSIKYNQKEYATLSDQAQALAKRLKVKAVDVERVAFVLMREQAGDAATAVNPEANPGAKTSAEDTKKKQPPAKRKASRSIPDTTAPIRRLLPISPISLCHSPPSIKDEMQSSPYAEPIPLPRRFSILKEQLVSGKETILVPSWQRLLQDLSHEVAQVSSSSDSQIIPTIDFADISKPNLTQPFQRQLRHRGVAIIRNVISQATAVDLHQEVKEYLDENAHLKPLPMTQSRLDEVYWSPPQIKARVHPNVLEAQRFAMGIWTSKDPTARASTNFPVIYADRMKIHSEEEEQGNTTTTPIARIDGGSVERWETDGYGRAGTYRDIFQGRWEDYDPWESSTRLRVTSDLYHKAGACSIFRMFQGWLALTPGSSSIRICPLPKHATAYFLLRPFFSPSSSTEYAEEEDEWTISQPQNSILHGALPSYPQEINPATHPHLQLHNSLVPVPRLEPGDYLIWHPDLIHIIESSSHSEENSVAAAASVMYLPACPLTQTNALYLSRQRKSFLLGVPPPDFGGGRGESNFAGRPGVQDVSEAGGEEGLRATGLLPFDEEESDCDFEREVLAMANGILFPNLYDML